MDWNVKYKTLFVDVKLLGLKVSSLVSPAQSIYYKVRSLTTKRCDLLRSLKRRLTQQITGIRRLITYYHGDRKGTWHESKYKLPAWLSPYHLRAGRCRVWEQLASRPTPTSHPHSLLATGRKAAREAGEESGPTSFVERANVSSYHMSASLSNVVNINLFGIHVKNVFNLLEINN